MDHLSRIIVASSSEPPINKFFSDEQLMSVSTEPWYADIVNYLAIDKVPSHWTIQDRYKFFVQVKYFIWDEPYLFKQYPDQITRRCVPDNEVRSILSFCHDQTCGGYFASKKIAAKVLQCGF